MEKLLLTPEEAAEVLSIGRSKLYQLLAAGDLHSVTIGSSRRVPVEALRVFVADIAGGAEREGTVGDGSTPSGAAQAADPTPPDADALTARRSA